MIVVEDLYKRYQTDRGPGKWVLEGVSFTIPPKTNVGLVGRNGAGKSTLLRLIGGIDQPSRGKVERLCRVSWPMGFGGGLQGSLTGRQNAKFVCRIHGHEEDIPERLAYIQDFAEIGDAFDDPVKTYSSGMQARLKFAISLAFDFDVYISDELTAVGDTAFKKKAVDAFARLVDRAGLIMVSHQENVLKEFCKSGIWLHEGRAQWFDDVCDALRAYNENLEAARDRTSDAGQVPAQKGDEEYRKAAARMNRMQKAINVLQQGMSGQPVTVDEETARQLTRQAARLGMDLMSAAQIREAGHTLKASAIPVLKTRSTKMNKTINLYDLHSQSVKSEDEEND